MAELFVPGRLCLFGEHSDWAGAYRATHPEIEPGRCLVAGTDQGLRADVDRRDGVVELSTVLPDGTRVGPVAIPARLDALDAAAREGGFFSYAAGVAAEATARWGAGGISMQVIANDLPVGKGLSSSAAVCVLMARAYDRLYTLGLSTRDEMRLAWAGERRTGSECGQMDQVCAYGRRTLLLGFDGAQFEVEAVPVGGSIAVLVVDLLRSKDTRRILADLNACFPDAPGAVAAGVRDALGAANLERVAAARYALEAGDAQRLGVLMTEAQDVFDVQVAPACPELAAPRLHEVLAHPAVRELAWGGKGVGSQGDGCAQLVARGHAERDELARRLRLDLAVACLPVTLGAPAAS